MHTSAEQKDPMPQYFRKENAAACSNPAFADPATSGLRALLAHWAHTWCRGPERLRLVRILLGYEIASQKVATTSYGCEHGLT